MLNRIFTVVSLVLVMQLAVPVARAQQAPAVSLSGDVKVVRNVEEAGVTKVSYETPGNVIPGDRLAFTTRYVNTSPETVEDFVITNPLPAAVALAETGDFAVSVNGGTAFDRLENLSVTLEDGATRPAELTDVTHIRWTLARLEPGANGSVQYFAVIR